MYWYSSDKYTTSKVKVFFVKCTNSTLLSSVGVKLGWLCWFGDPDLQVLQLTVVRAGMRSVVDSRLAASEADVSVEV